MRVGDVPKKPPLRHFMPPLLKERQFVRLPLRGIVGKADLGVAIEK